jgi:hypothetical protein
LTICDTEFVGHKAISSWSSSSVQRDMVGPWSRRPPASGAMTADSCGDVLAIASFPQPRRRSIEPCHFASSVAAGFKVDTSNSRIELSQRYRLTTKQTVAAAMQIIAARRDRAMPAARSRICSSSSGIMPSAPLDVAEPVELLLPPVPVVQEPSNLNDTLSLAR